MIPEIIKKLNYTYMKKIRQGEDGAADWYLDKLNQIKDCVFGDYNSAVYLMFEEWGLKGKIDNAQLKLMWDGANETYENDLKKILESK